VLIALFTVTGVQAQGEGIRNPMPLLKGGDRARASVPGSDEKAGGRTARTVAREKDPGARLEMRLKRTEIYNPQSGAMDTVWLRGYVDLEREEERRKQKSAANDSEANDLVAAPLIEAVPGETIRIDLYNHMLPWTQLPTKASGPQEKSIIFREDFESAGLEEAVYKELIPEGECDHAKHGPEDMNEPNDHPGCFNVTNNHFHGGWVNPAGNSDNVLRLLHPGANVVHEYEYNIPADHPAGTFWYHPHVHGSTAIQVASGMAGALIVRGDRWPEPSGIDPDKFRAGDIDVLLRKSDDTPIPDRIFLLQQIQYKCFDAATWKDKIWKCDEGDIGAIVNYDNMGGPNNWNDSGRFTTVNGHVAGRLGIGKTDDDNKGSAADDNKVVAGQPERWRFIHAGFNDTIMVQIVPAKKLPKSDGSDDDESVADLFKNKTAAETDAAIEQLCDFKVGEIDDTAIEMFEIAADGLTRVQALQTKSRTLQPGYRSDVLVSFPQPEPQPQPDGTVRHFQEYCVIDVPTSGQTEGSIDKKRLLFTVRVEKNEALEQVPDAKTAIRNTMVTAAAQATDKRIREGKDISLLPEILNDLFDDLKLNYFSPHNTLIGEATAEDTAKKTEKEAWESVDYVRLLRFNLQVREPRGPGDTSPGIGHQRYSRADYESVAGDEAMSGRVPKELWDKDKLSDVRFSERPDELIALQLGNIDEWRLRSAGFGHPFHIHVNPFQVVRVTRNGVDLTEDETSQYFGMKGVFKDTIMVESDDVEVVIRSHYERYIGRFVLHCHILPHEDRGMMRLVEIYDPGTPGGLKQIEERQIAPAHPDHG